MSHDHVNTNDEKTKGKRPQPNLSPETSLDSIANAAAAPDFGFLTGTALGAPGDTPSTLASKLQRLPNKDMRVQAFRTLQTRRGNAYATRVARHMDGAAVQRQEPGDDAHSLQLTAPQLGSGLGFHAPSDNLGTPQLHLDPEIAAQIRAIEMMRSLVSVESILGASAGAPIPSLVPPASTGGGASPPPAGGLDIPLAPQSPPLVPRGAGPAQSRPGEIGDLLQGVLQIPAVQDGVRRLQTEAEGRIRRDWSQLGTGQRGLVVGTGIVIVGTALAGVLSNPEARTFFLNQVQDRSIPVPGLPLTFQFNVTGPDQRLFMTLDVGALLPRGMGFGPSE